MASLSRDQLIQRARSVPKNVFGAASVTGYIATIAGIVLLIVSVPGLTGGSGLRPDWRLALAVLAVGIALILVLLKSRPQSSSL